MANSPAGPPVGPFRIFDRLHIRGKLIASFGLAMVLVLVSLGWVTYLTFADTVMAAQERVAVLMADRVLHRLQAAATVAPKPGSPSHEAPAARSPGAPTASNTAPPVTAPANFAAALPPLQALGLAPEVSLLLDRGSGPWLRVQPGQADTTQLPQRLQTATPEAVLNGGALRRRVDDLWVYSVTATAGGWTLHYALPHAVLSADLTTLRSRVIATTVLVAWVAGWMVLIIAHRLARPVQTLSRVMATAERATEGPPPDLLKRRDEIGELAREFESLRQRVGTLVNTDALTGVCNRRGITHQLRQAIENAVAAPAPLACLLLDVDYFKSVNDSLGHPCGDQALVHCARTLQGLARPGDIVARFGGEEFLVLLTHTPGDAAQACAERLRRGVENSPVPWQGGRLPLTLSIGLSTLTPPLLALARQSPAAAVQQLLANADAALYEAKRRGRNRSVVWQHGPGDAAGDGVTDRSGDGFLEVPASPRRPAQPCRAESPGHASARGLAAGADADQGVERAVAQQRGG